MGLPSLEVLWTGPQTWYIGTLRDHDPGTLPNTISGHGILWITIPGHAVIVSLGGRLRALRAARAPPPCHQPLWTT